MTRRIRTSSVIVAIASIIVLAGCGENDEIAPRTLSPARRSSLAALTPSDTTFTTNYPRPVTVDPLHVESDTTLARTYSNFSCVPATTSAEESHLSIDATTRAVTIDPGAANTDPRWNCVVTKTNTTYHFTITGHVTDGTFH